MSYDHFFNGQHGGQNPGNNDPHPYLTHSNLANDQIQNFPLASNHPEALSNAYQDPVFGGPQPTGDNPQFSSQDYTTQNSFLDGINRVHPTGHEQFHVPVRVPVPEFIQNHFRAHKSQTPQGLSTSESLCRGQTHTENQRPGVSSGNPRASLPLHPGQLIDSRGVAMTEIDAQLRHKEFLMYQDVPPPNFSQFKTGGSSIPNSGTQNHILHNRTGVGANEAHLRRVVGQQWGPENQQLFPQQHQQYQQYQQHLQDHQDQQDRQYQQHLQHLQHLQHQNQEKQHQEKQRLEKQRQERHREIQEEKRQQDQEREMKQSVHAKPFHPQSKRQEAFHFDLPVNNTNSSLMPMNLCLEPHPPRWSSEDVTTGSSSTELPATFKGGPTEETSDDEEVLDEEYLEDEEEGIARRSMTPALSFALLGLISRTPSHPAYVAHCPHLLEGRCKAASKHNRCCRDKLHFKRIIHAQTDPLFPESVMKRIQELNKEELMTLGNPLMDELQGKAGEMENLGSIKNEDEGAWSIGEKDILDNTNSAKKGVSFPPSASAPPQWIRCDITKFDLGILGKFRAIMADPPWDIRMTLPYGTVPDQAIIDLPLGSLQDEGLFFLWCTARTIDAGHACLRAWGYRFCDEIAWVKVDHLNRLISVGRTGHWLNHTMEHCLVGIKGNPTWINKGIDMDVIVAQPRATSHKPDEIYDVIGRLVGLEARKLELFGREHNIRKGWLTLGNQLPHSHIHEKALKGAYMNYLSRAGYPYTYNAAWNPWANGFDRYGYGVMNDWREERKIGVLKSRAQVSNMRGRGGRGNNNASLSQPRPGFRKDFQGLERGQQGETGNVNSHNQQSQQLNRQKYHQKQPQQKYQRGGSYRGGYQQKNQQGREHYQSNTRMNSQKTSFQGNQKGKNGEVEEKSGNQSAYFETNDRDKDYEELGEQFTGLDFI
ncbi:uncharacterized protein H6S33_006089 [Morchella sextelata]|uniref:uncharacterized protein n=1 Tax=Morchella sextelata TaxID=1174677 RepID=UPI001D03E4AA|nr:uncharacterized protein H6S33_006089 [Morchella sextelata]KAH0614203.1 hypothetical protein H6S33_006089 [Morchella sextelata]